MVLFSILCTRIFSKIICTNITPKNGVRRFCIVHNTDLCTIKMLEDMDNIHIKCKNCEALEGVTSPEMFLVCYLILIGKTMGGHI